MEHNILHETANLYLYRAGDKLELRLIGGTHSVVVGYPKDAESGRRTIERLERHPENLRAMYQHF